MHIENRTNSTSSSDALASSTPFSRNILIKSTSPRRELVASIASRPLTPPAPLIPLPPLPSSSKSSPSSNNLLTDSGVAVSAREVVLS